jgi:hypothetical protein
VILSLLFAFVDPQQRMTWFFLPAFILCKVCRRAFCPRRFLARDVEMHFVLLPFFARDANMHFASGHSLRGMPKCILPGGIVFGKCRLA